ncbi:hypothetical protein ACRBF7_001326 [Providencia stuartii]|uniref:hypothetical protein n=1 Tax=Providencia stuartii TaxID=588 RepID=UPI000C9B3C2B|nr:hypothetical protein [Providencia stuartii]HEM8214761.1 hypothetical protein [Providencia stuartii]
MSISKEKLDNLKKSIAIPHELGHYEMMHRIDKISIVGDLETDDIKEFFDRLNKMKGNPIYSIERKKVTDENMSKLYQYQIEVRNKTNSEQMVIIHYMPTEIDFKKTDKYQGRGAVRFEFSPQHFSFDDINKLVLYLGNKKRLDNYLYKILKSAWVTRIDYALDIYDMRLSDYHIGFKGACCGERYSSEGEFQGQRLGSNKSEYHASCYEKLDVGDDLDTLHDKDLQLIITNWREIQDYRRFLRLEVRYKPRCKALLLRDIRNLHNLLERIGFYKKPLRTKKGDLDWESLLSGMTLPELRDYVKETYPNEVKKIFKRLDNRLKSNQFDLFDKDEIWCDFHLLVEKLGILGVPALWQKSLREKWALKHGY